MKLKPHETWEIQRVIRAYLEDPAILRGLTLDLVSLARRFDALPVSADMGGALLIRPSGEVILVHSNQPWGLESEHEVVTDPGWRTIAFVEAGERFPSLSFLRPERPDTAVDCPSCGGTGRVPFADQKVMCGACHALGWVGPIGR
ncbi:MAG: hypothetical protein ACREAA_20775 [Candidatus Polarisedimenticolia bacterium]